MYVKDTDRKKLKLSNQRISAVNINLITMPF